MWSPFKSNSGSGGGGRGAPVDRVMSLSSQGMSEQQIIQTMKNEGYSPNQVDSAMRQALRSSAGGMQPPETPQMNMGPPSSSSRPMYAPPQNDPPRPLEMGSPMDMPDDFSRVPESLRMPEVPRTRDEFDVDNSIATGMDRRIDDDFDDVDLPPPPGSRGNPRFDEPEIDTFRSDPRDRRRGKERELEEMAEGIADEKWNDFRVETSELRTEIKDIVDRVVVLERTLRKLQEQKNSEIEGIRTTISGYQTSLTDVGEKMEGMEKALKDSLGPMMETLRSLSDTVQMLKKPSRI